MSELISGKEAKLAWASGADIQYKPLNEWQNLGGATPISIFSRFDIAFRLKPKTITINGIEVPMTFEPKMGDIYWIIDTSDPNGYSYIEFEDDKYDKNLTKLGAWRTEDEIKQVVEALRSVFNAN